MSDISSRIKQARKQLGFSQREAAKNWGMPYGTLRDWEQGRRQPRGLALRALEALLAEAERGDAGRRAAGHRGA